jgi:membrane protein insertase Oxa1/YidC/SpoIIIJ
MTLIFPVFLYNMPAGLNIYILTSTTFGIIESKIIRDKLKRLDAAEAAGTVSIVDSGPPRDTPGGAGSGARRKPMTPKGGSGAAVPAKKGLMGWVEEMQSRVEDIKKEQERKDRDKKK